MVIYAIQPELCPGLANKVNKGNGIGRHVFNRTYQTTLTFPMIMKMAGGNSRKHRKSKLLLTAYSIPGTANRYERFQLISAMTLLPAMKKKDETRKGCRGNVRRQETENSSTKEFRRLPTRDATRQYRKFDCFFLSSIYLLGASQRRKELACTFLQLQQSSASPVPQRSSIACVSKVIVRSCVCLRSCGHRREKYAQRK